MTVLMAKVLRNHATDLRQKRSFLDHCFLLAFLSVNARSFARGILVHGSQACGKMLMLFAPSLCYEFESKAPQGHR